MPTDHEFNDFGSQVFADAAKEWVNARQELLKNGTPVEAEVYTKLEEAYDGALTQGMDAERVEEFKPRGLLNLPDIEITISGVELADKYPRWTLAIKRTWGPYLKGVCGCGWETEERLRTVTIAEAWDEHMLASDPALHAAEAVDGG